MSNSVLKEKAMELIAELYAIEEMTEKQINKMIDFLSPQILHTNKLISAR
jgi:DNA-directed RNA polymerase subunit F